MSGQSYEMVDNSTTVTDLENGPMNLRSKFDEIALPTSRFRKNKRLFIVIGSLVVLWIIGIVVYYTGASGQVLDYYKSKIGTTGDDLAPEVDNYNDSGKGETPDVQLVGNVNVESPKGVDDNQNKNDQEDDENAIFDNENKQSEKLTMADLRAGKFYVYQTNLEFLKSSVAGKDEGLFYYPDRDGYFARKAQDLKFKQKLSSPTFTYNDQSYSISKFYPNYALTYAIIATDVEKIFRHSSIAHYWLYDINQQTVKPISTNPDSLETLSFASWSPKYSYITILKENNIYIQEVSSGTLRKITTDGSDTILNGKTDWVYEEEVLAVDQAVWWAPDDSKFVYMKTDDTGVPNYNIDYYVQGSGGATKYPISKQIAYPKPGFKNPYVSLFNYDLATGETTEIKREDSKLGEEFIVYQVFFINQESVIIKETDRESNILNYRHFNTGTKESKIIFEVNAKEEYGGWIEKFNDPLVIPTGGWVDTLVVGGYNHLVYFTAPESKPLILTSGDWEVLNSELGYDGEKIYFLANRYSSLDKHLYSVTLKGDLQGGLNIDKPGFYNVKFSNSAKYASVNNDGPNMPTQQLFNLEQGTALEQLSNSARLRVAETTFDLPQKKFQRVKVDINDEDGTDVELNVIEYLPKGFDQNLKYPLLVHFYGGPGSQVVNRAYSIDFEDTISSSLNAVVLYIEPRGTGGQGWKFRSWARGKIGYWEPKDITTVTKQWIEKGFIDVSKTAAWGWSYGGFTTLKTLEYDAGETFKYGMAVAPVTNWELYDSIYTERYMDKPENNVQGYSNSKITKMENLKKVERFLVMHGTADDNVHVQNTYNLLDELNLKNVENYDVQLFPDSEHSIYYHNANTIVYDKLTKWLKDAFDGDFEKLGTK